MLAKKSETSRKVTVTEHYVTRALLKAESYTKTSPVCSQSKGVTTTTSTMHQTRLTNILIYDGNGDNLTRSPQPPPQTSATFRELFATFGKTTTTIKIGFYFFTYEWSRRRLPLIKMINGVEEVLILLLTAFRYEYLFEVPSYAFE